MKLLSFFSLLLAIFAIDGCTSPQIRNHTLLPPAPLSGSSNKVPFVIELLPIGVPEQLDITQVVLRQDGNTMLVLNNDRWLSPPSEEMHSALSPQIAQRLGTQDISGLPKVEEKQVMRIQIQLRRFDLWPGNQVRLDADWSLSTRNGGQRQRLLCQSRLSMSAPADYLQVFPVAQRLVTLLAIEIADTAAYWHSSESASCTQQK
ncbi:TPA: PqiC family protein [Raoultella planticola]|jgi:uncharacterized lipoprotein YmbA|uniref:Membrane integrity-associated transporter subunit PqiC n=1 Tax=Raoultella planticola TaxID=575 RepID=A0AAN5L197_RAOPL|nr:PqiC family protein [Raoultella planticola]EKW5590088.1 membrane integrity-associated transporter subunit PqiC [Raoultella planticola]MBE0016812.1 membrane integrity-associated transporter subunit PqiC [Raoultella planticola]MBZ7830818.1 membrane integrity-associated transporter subunit PqiC [Raoultella planticola]MDM9677864.1 PqiC family protein [Raoultella planticola]MDV1188287.1 PqiC family protein [Raoultella planticola]